jgi:hypothetical protein
LGWTVNGINIDLDAMLDRAITVTRLWRGIAAIEVMEYSVTKKPSQGELRAGDAISVLVDVPA